VLLFVMTLLSTSLLAGEYPDISAAPELVQAEYYQVSDELKKLAHRQAWGGASRRFDQLLGLGLPLTYDHWLAGAMAARNLGDTAAAYDRLTQAAKLEGNHEVVDWLWSLDTQFGRVTLRSEFKKPTLAAAAMPMIPDQRAAVRRAQLLVSETGAFSGMLPAGDYRLSGHSFTVTPGPQAVEIVITKVEVTQRVVAVADSE
jgi:hypothetical protein